MDYFGFKKVRIKIMFASGRVVDHYKTDIFSKIVQKFAKGLCGQV
jgi:hypothetical protein